MASKNEVLEQSSLEVAESPQEIKNNIGRLQSRMAVGTAELALIQRYTKGLWETSSLSIILKINYLFINTKWSRVTLTLFFKALLYSIL